MSVINPLGAEWTGWRERDWGQRPATVPTVGKKREGQVHERWTVSPSWGLMCWSGRGGEGNEEAERREGWRLGSTGGWWEEGSHGDAI